MDNKKLNRRSFIRFTGVALGTLPFLNLRKAIANQGNKDDKKICPAEAPEGVKAKKIADPESKSAKRLKYITDATVSEHKKYKKGDACGNCKFYKMKKEKGGYAPCSMFANKYVTKCGWCKSYKKDKKLYKIFQFLGEKKT